MYPADHPPCYMLHMLLSNFCPGCFRLGTQESLCAHACVLCRIIEVSLVLGNFLGLLSLNFIAFRGNSCSGGFGLGAQSNLVSACTLAFCVMSLRCTLYWTISSTCFLFTSRFFAATAGWSGCVRLDINLLDCLRLYQLSFFFCHLVFLF